MTENERFYIGESILKEGFVIRDKEQEYTFPVLEYKMNFIFKKALNELNDECEFLEFENELLENTAKKYAKLYHQSFRDKVCSAIDKRINELENDYDKAVKAGMPSMSVYSEIELLEELKKELEE